MSMYDFSGVTACSCLSCSMPVGHGLAELHAPQEIHQFSMQWFLSVSFCIDGESNICCQPIEHWESYSCMLLYWIHIFSLYSEQATQCSFPSTHCSLRLTLHDAG